jgi:hypothetical protein
MLACPTLGRRGGHAMMDSEIPDDRAAVAEYVTEMTAELAVLAAWAECTDLARILEMARLEAERLCGRSPNAGEPAADATTSAPEQPDHSQSANVILLSALRAARR